MKDKPAGHAPHSARITAQKGPIVPVASKTSFVPKYSEDRKWLLIDAAGQTVGRLASEIAMLLRGKHKPTFTPNNDAGDFVIVINAEKVVFTANKEDQKEYFKHSGWIGGMKVTTPARLRGTHPDRILFHAVRGMVPRTPLGRDQMGKLNIYAGENHPHAGQKPAVWNLRYSANRKA
ncbi:MAG: 50S ribosomal protein L13 [Bdellovibrionales bacterium]|nr:50S ribosomal protein L13 [Bdellovibrionales bacterium]